MSLLQLYFLSYSFDYLWRIVADYSMLWLLAITLDTVLHNYDLSIQPSRFFCLRQFEAFLLVNFLFIMILEFDQEKLKVWFWCFKAIILGYELYRVFFHREFHILWLLMTIHHILSWIFTLLKFEEPYTMVTLRRWRKQVDEDHQLPLRIQNQIVW